MVLRFYLTGAISNLVRGHVEGFAFFGTVSRSVRPDNLKSAVLERRAAAIRFDPRWLALAAFYRFQPRPEAVDCYGVDF